MCATLDVQCVINANAQFWQQMLAMTLDPVPSPDSFREAAGHVLSGVTLSGTWHGRIEVRLAIGLAQQATAAMLMQPADTVAEADTLDAAKEIANMIAGVIKASLPRPCAMTVPESCVALEEFSSCAARGNSLAVLFRHAAGDLLVRVLENQADQESPPRRAALP